MAKVARLSPSSRFAELADAWLHQLGTTKPAANTVAAYRRDLECGGVCPNAAVAPLAEGR